MIRVDHVMPRIFQIKLSEGFSLIISHRDRSSSTKNTKASSIYDEIFLMRSAEKLFFFQCTVVCNACTYIPFAKDESNFWHILCGNEHVYPIHTWQRIDAHIIHDRCRGVNPILCISQIFNGTLEQAVAKKNIGFHHLPH